ncbi:MAG: MFS transporter [Pseudomonadota bacterium]|nr:MFS transporter [Pseudomonadota bacterium]
MGREQVADKRTAAALGLLVKINAVSFLSQIVQIGTIPPLLALRLSAAHQSALTIGAVAAAPWIAILSMGQWAPCVLSRCGFVTTNRIALGLSVVAVVSALPETNPILLFTSNFVFGIGLILRWVACDTWIVWAAPNHIRGRAIGTHETLMGCGIAAGPLVIAITGYLGTRPLWSCIGLLILSNAALALLRGNDGHPDMPERTNRLGALQIVPTALTAGFVAGFVETSSISFLPLLSTRHVLALGVTAVLGGFGAGGTILQMPLGWLADTVGIRVMQFLTAAVVAIGALALPVVGHHSGFLLPLLFIWGGAAGGMNTLAVIEVGQRVDGPGMSTGLMAVALAYTVGGVTGPVLTGCVTSRLPAGGLAIGSVAAVMAFFGACAVTAAARRQVIRAAQAA